MLRKKLTDPAQAGSAASGRTTGTMPSQRPADRTPRAPTRHRAKRGGLLLLATATLLLIPALAYADVPVATISGPVSVAEGDNAVYTVTLEGGTGSEDIVFDYTVTGTVSETDYMDQATVDGKLTLPESGGTTLSTGTITLQIEDDGIDEIAETLIVTLTKVTTDAGMVAIGSPNSVTTTILPDGTTTVSFEGTSVSVAESENLVFTVQLLDGTTSTSISEAVTVRYDTIPGTASRTDYGPVSGTFTIDAGEEFATLTLMPDDDNQAEDTETFTVRLTLMNPPDDVALGMATATGTITDNEMVRAKVTASDTTVVEGSVVTFTVELEPGVGSEDVVVTYHTNAGSADPDDDFEAPEGTLTIPAGDTMGTIDVRTHTDAFLEGTETLIVTLTDASSGVGDVDLMNNVEPAETVIGDPDGTILVSVEDATTTEGEPAKLIVRLSGKVSADMILTYTIAPGDDYTVPNPAEVEILATETTGTISVPTENDELAEAAETFTVTLDPLDPLDPLTLAGVARGRATATATINDNDPLTVTVVGSVDRIREGSQATFTVEVDGGKSTMPIEVDYTVGGTATAGADYDEPEGEGTLTIDTGHATATIPPFKTYQDTEADETLVVTLTGVRTEAGTVTLGTPSVARATLVEQETVIILVADSETGEDAQASFAVSVSGDLTGAVKLRYETAHGTAGAEDYTATSETVDIVDTPDESYTTPITVVVADDSLAEGDEVFHA